MKKILLLALGIVAIGVVGLVTSDSQAATLGQLDNEQMLATDGRGCCGALYIRPGIWCEYGAPVRGCPMGWPACEGTCWTDCSSIGGWAFNGTQLYSGHVQPEACLDAGSTFTIRECYYSGEDSCSCSGTIISTGNPCPRGWFRLQGC